MKPKPKIKPRLMWGFYNRSGILIYQPTFHRDTLISILNNQHDASTYIRRVLVSAPPKRRKRHAKR